MRYAIEVAKLNEEQKRTFIDWLNETHNKNYYGTSNWYNFEPDSNWDDCWFTKPTDPEITYEEWQKLIELPTQLYEIY